jgi:hypothetical protein
LSAYNAKDGRWFHDKKGSLAVHPRRVIDG